MSRKYRLSVDVPWQEVSKLFSWRLGVMVRSAQGWISDAVIDRNHDLSDDYLRFHEYRAAQECEKIFDFVSVYNSLRSFLGWKPLDESVRGISGLRHWYSERSEEAFCYGPVYPPTKGPFKDDYPSTYL